MNVKYDLKNTTLHDIAKRLGISTSTVSRALSDHPNIKYETKEKIKKIAKDSNYSPNLIAKNLKNNRSTTIGIIVPEIKRHFFSSAISGIEESAYKSGYTIIVCQTNESYERELINTNVLMNHRVAGVIVSISQNTRNGKHFQDLQKKKIPLVFFDRVCSDVNASKIVIDDYKNAFDAVAYLINKGYKNIVHFAGPKELDICINRRNGYIDALRQVHIQSTNGHIRQGGMSERDGYISMDTLLNENALPDAVFAVNDYVAVGAFKRIKEARLRIPEDIAIFGFGNDYITSLVEPQITTIEQPSFEMGRRSAEILIDIIEGKDIEPRTWVLNTKLIIRGST